MANWFWKRWFFDDGYPDLTITKVQHNGNEYKVLINSKGSKPVPVDLVIYFNNGDTQTIHKTVDVWEKGNSTITITFQVNNPVIKLGLGSLHIPDSNKKDNLYKF